MEGDTTFKEHLPFVRLLPCLAVGIVSLLATNSSLLRPSLFEEESDSSDEDTDQEGLDELPPDEVDPDQEVKTDKFKSQKFNIDAVVTLAAAIFTSKTYYLEAQTLRCSHANDLGGPDALLHERYSSSPGCFSICICRRT